MLRSGESLQEIGNIPLTPAASGKRTGPVGDSLHIHALLGQSLDMTPPRAAAMTHDLIGLPAVITHRPPSGHGDTSLNTPPANTSAQRTVLPVYTDCIAMRYSCICAR